MAIFRLQIEPITRDGTRSSVGAAAYRAGEKIRDDRTNEVHNHSRRKDVTHSEILLPTHLTGQDMEWARNRASLWNTAESAESRKNARVATEIQVTLPSELPPERRLQIARTFSQEVADNYNVAVDLAVHDPRPSGDPRNFHAHLMLTTREVTPAGLGAKTGLNLQSSERARLGLPDVSQEFKAIRERWATITNKALEAEHIDARIDHRSLAEQGIDREPRPHIPFAAFKIERTGKHSEVAANIRADYAARVQARQERSAQNELNVGSRDAVPSAAPASNAAPAPAQPANTPVQPANASPQPPATAGKSMEDIRREARENWLRLRAAQSSAITPAPTAKDPRLGKSESATRSPPARDDDHHP